MKQINNNDLKVFNELQGVKKLDVKLNTKKLYYLTQYASYMTDSGYYLSLKECLTSNFKKEGLKQQDVNEVMQELEMLSSELMPLVSDSINKEVYHLLFSIKNLEQITNINNFYDNIINNNIYDIPGIEDYMRDNSIFSPDLWHELADDDLRQNGTDANALYWVNDIDFNCDFLEMNGYCNGFYELSAEDVILQYLTDGYFNYSDLLSV